LQIINAFQIDVKHVLLDPVIQEELSLRLIRLDVDTAAVVWVTGNFTFQQWNTVSKALDGLVCQADLHTKGGILPSVTTLKKWCDL
jgi:hypothetical protein